MPDLDSSQPYLKEFWENILAIANYLDFDYELDQEPYFNRDKNNEYLKFYKINLGTKIT